MTLFLNNRLGQGRFPDISKPKLKGYFSIDSNRQMWYNSSQLRYFCPPPHNDSIRFDLNHGLHAVRRKPASADDEKIDFLLQWIKDNYMNKNFVNNEKWLPIDFVCWRGLLTRVMKTPYDGKEGWIVCAAKWKGTIYLCQFDVKTVKYEKLYQNEKNSQLSSWGFKFEQYVLSDAPNKLPETNKPVDESEEFSCVFETRLMNNTILYGAEMDGIISDEILNDPLPPEKLKFIELKTNAIIESNQQFYGLKQFKFLRWWCQSFLVGIEDIACGFRDKNGIVQRIEYYRVFELPQLSKEHWNAPRLMNFCDIFLNHIAKIVINDCDKTIYKFERIPFGDIVTTELSPSSEYSFLPEWYTKCHQ